MIHPINELQWMDVKAGKVTKGSAMNLFQEYAHRVMRVRNGVKELLFSPGELKITDWRGWTDVEYIRKVEALMMPWVTISAGDKTIIVSSGEEIPVYEETTPRKGFHGASVFAYKLKTAREFDPRTDFVRVRRGLDRNGDPIEFDHPMIIKTDTGTIGFGYEIGTRSKFFNCNNFHIFGSDDVPEKMEVSR
ncbi:MAG: hypothetical protein NC548_37020 [Lachnospiraceae bacterium]|nr:hypothetical protein [Lachnospiraceae bacterium]